MSLYVTYEPVNFVIREFRVTQGPPPPPLSFFSKRKIFRSSSGDIYFFHSTLLIFSGYKDIEETKIICTNLSNLSGAIVLWGKVSLKSQPSPPLTHGGRGGER